MKLQGHTFDRPSVEFVVIPRGHDRETGEKIPDIVFTCGPVKDFSEFEALCSVPIAPAVIKPGGKREPNFDDQEYQAQVHRRGLLRFTYTILKSLQYTDGLEWETVKFSEPKTWKNYEDELREAGFTDAEINRIVLGVMSANSLNQARVDEALANFQRGQEAALAAISGQNTGPNSSQSGESASVSE